MPRCPFQFSCGHGWYAVEMGIHTTQPRARRVSDALQRWSAWYARMHARAHAQRGSLIERERERSSRASRRRGGGDRCAVRSDAWSGENRESGVSHSSVSRLRRMAMRLCSGCSGFAFGTPTSAPYDYSLKTYFLVIPRYIYYGRIWRARLALPYQVNTYSRDETRSQVPSSFLLRFPTLPRQLSGLLFSVIYGPRPCPRRGTGRVSHLKYK